MASTLAIVEGIEHVCCRYRVRAFAPWFERAGWSLRVDGLERGVLGRRRQIRAASTFDSVLLQRKLLPRWQLRWLRRQARHLVFDFDDAVPYRDSYDPRGPHCRRRSVRFAATVRAADVVLAGNDFLAELAVGAGARADRVRVMPTCVDVGRYRPIESTDPCLTQLVWVGSSSTLKGLEGRRDLLRRLGREVRGLTLRVICDRTPGFAPLPVIGINWSEAAEAAEIAGGDVGISLVPDDLWSRGKCGLKVLQYQAAGLPVVADPVGVHPVMIRPGVDGELPRTDDEWVEAIRRLADDPDRRHRMGRAAREAVAANYDVKVWAPSFVAALGGTSTLPPPKGVSGRRVDVPAHAHVFNTTEAR